MVLERRLVAGKLPLLVGEARQALVAVRGGPIAGLRIARPSRAVLVVPWGYRDVLRVAAFSTLALFFTVLCLFLARVILSIGLLLAEGLRIVPTGSFARLDALGAPYGMAAANALLALVFTGALLYSTHRTIIGPYRLRWSSLGMVRSERTYFGRALLLFLALTALGALVNKIVTIVLGSGKQGIVTPLITNGVTARPLNVVLIGTVLVVLMPVVEEVLFRGLLFKLLRNRFGFLAAAALSALPCALLQLAPAAVPWLFCMGIVYAYLAEQSRSLYPGIVLHGLVNALAALGAVALLYGL